MFLTKQEINNFYDIFDIGEIIKVNTEKYTANVVTEGGKHLLDVPFIYNYIYSNYTLSDSNSVQFVKDQGDIALPSKLLVNEGQGILYMPEEGTQVLIIYIKQQPYIFGFYLENVGTANNTYNKPKILQGELRFQVRDGAYLHIRRRGELDIFATPLARIILSSIENTMKMFLENAFKYFNVGHIYFTTDYEDGTTEYEMWLRPNMKTKKNYFRVKVGGDTNFVDIHVSRTQDKSYEDEDDKEEIPVWNFHIREDGNSVLEISTNPDDKELQSKLIWELGVDEKYDFKLITNGEEKVHIHINENGDINMSTKGSLEMEIDKTSKIHCKEDFTLKADGNLYLQGANIYEN